MSDVTPLFEEKPETILSEVPKPEASKPEPAKRLKLIDRNQSFWGAIDIEKLIEQEHAARGIWAMVSRLDLKRLEEKIKAVAGRPGQSSLDPRLLMALWIYGYSEGINSARELSRMCEHEPGCRWLTAMQSVNYHTLSDFRVEHKKDLDEIFVQVLGLLSAEGLIEMKRIAQDGTKIKANVGAGSFRREDRIRLHLQLAREQVDKLGSPESEEENQRVMQARKRAIREKKQRLEDALRELEQIQQGQPEAEKHQVRVSETDPEARVMKQAGGGFAPSYNVQVSTDAAAGIIVGVEVTQAGNDYDQLVDGINRVETNTGQTPGQILVDGGYTKNSNVEAMAERGIDLIGPINQSHSQGSLKQRGVQPEFYPEKFQYDPVADAFSCPSGKTLKRIRKHQRKSRIEYTYGALEADCLSCPYRGQCCPQNFPRRIMRTEHSLAVQAFEAKMATDEAKKVYRTRAQIAEFPNAWIKEKIGLRRFRLRTRIKVRVEAVWVCLTYNIQQWLRLAWRPNLAVALSNG